MASWRRQHQPVESMDTLKSNLVTNTSTTSSRHIKQTSTITTTESSLSTTKSAIKSALNETVTAVTAQNETLRVDNNDVNTTTSEASPTKKPKKKLSDASGKKKSKKSKKSDAEKENISVASILPTNVPADITTKAFPSKQASKAINNSIDTSIQHTISRNNQDTLNQKQFHSSYRNVRFFLNSENNNTRKNIQCNDEKTNQGRTIQIKNESKHAKLQNFDQKKSIICPTNSADWSSFVDVKKLRKLYQPTDENSKPPGYSVWPQKSFKTHIPDAHNMEAEAMNNFHSISMKSFDTFQSCGDLNNFPREIVITKEFSNLKRTKSYGDILDKELNRLVLSGVSVKTLRDSYCSLVTLEGCENRKKKSSFSKFDALQKKNLIHVRSNDAGKVQEKFNEAQLEVEKNCRACGKIVYKMEEMKAERNTWHKNCFKCNECKKPLNVDTYQSHESILYCKPHFRMLFAPKAVEDNEPVRPRKPELIIRENEPAELPADVVRSSDKPDLGLEDLQQLNVKERFQVFEHFKDHSNEDRPPINRDRSPTGVKRSTSILSKLAKFQAKGMDTGLDNESLSAIQYENSSDTEEEEEDDIDDDNEDAVLIRAKRAQRERPMSFRNMNDIKSKFENGHMVSREERREERKQEIQNIRSRLFMGKQARIKEMYQQAVADSEQAITSTGKKPEIDIGDKARTLKEKFEKGEIFNENKNGVDKIEDEMDVFEQGISKNSRSIFKNLESSQQQQAPIPNQGPRTPDANSKKPQVSKLQEDKCKPFLGTGDIVKSTDKSEDIKIETSEVSSKFKFFEQYRPTEKERKPFRITPPREGALKTELPETEAEVGPEDEQPDDKSIAKERHTATKMLSIFRQMEESNSNGNFESESVPRPLKRFTPPLDGNRRVYNNESEEDDDYEEGDSEDEEEEEEEEEEESEEEDPRAKYNDEALRQAQAAARAKQLRAKFEKWEANEIQREMNNSSVNLYEYYENSDEGQVESAKSLRAKFEALQDTQGKPSLRPRVQVNRFV